MTFAMIAAGALLATTGQPKDPSIKVGLHTERFYQWMILPGGGVVPMPTPFMVLVPLGRYSSSELPMPAKLRQEMHIVIQSEKEGVFTESFTRKVMDGLKQVIADAQDLETMTSDETVPKANCKKSDPKQVIDPIVTGF